MVTEEVKRWSEPGHMLKIRPVRILMDWMCSGTEWLAADAKM